jgi:16S rRNA (guanine527-N7)-methyltransferase
MFHVEHCQTKRRGPVNRDAGNPVGSEELLQRFAERIRSSPHNLLSRQGVEELESRHIPESVRFAQALPVASELLDIGSGGGLPGVVIAIVRPDIHVHLLEATTKKAEFLANATTAIGLDVTVHNGRAEDLGRGALADRFEIVTARAVARLDRLAELAMPFLAPGGILYAIKGQRWAEEASEDQRLVLEIISTPDRGSLTGAEGPLVVGLRRRVR